MKKAKFILTMAAMASVAAFTGCSANISMEEPANGTTPTVTIQASMAESIAAQTSQPVNQVNASVEMPVTENASTATTQTVITEAQFATETEPNQESLPNVFAEVNEEWNYVLPGDGAEEFAYLFEVKYDEATGKEYGTIVCQGDKGAYWTYETGKFEVGQSSSVELLEGPVNCIILNEGGTITALNITDGNVLWRNKDFQGSGSVCTMDENDNLYIAGNESPGLQVIDANGKTVCRVAQFGDYFWPYDMYIDENNMLTILFDSADNAKVVMDINTFSYTIY